MRQIEYKNFDVLIHGWDGNQYPTRVLSSPAGETRGELSFLTLVPDVMTNLKSLRDFALNEASEIQSEAERWKQAKRLGELLFDGLMSGEVRSCFDVSLNLARRNEQGLRIRLRIEPPELAALPWELKRDKRSDSFLSLSYNSPIVRYIELQQTTLPLVTGKPICILVVVSSPLDQQQLDIEHEMSQMQRALDDLIKSGAVKITTLREANSLVIQKTLREEEINVLHYIGHGYFSNEDMEGYLLFETSQRASQLISGRKIGEMLRDEDTLRLVVLNACSTSTTTESNLFSGVAATLVQAGIPAVVAMQTSITDEAALRFSRVFYESLAYGYPIDSATGEARKAINFLSSHTVEWAIPQLFMRIGNGVLFDFDPSEPATKSRSQDANPEKSVIASSRESNLTRFTASAQQRAQPSPQRASEQSVIASNSVSTVKEICAAADFYIDIRPVTNEEFRRFIEATRAESPSTWHRNIFPRAKADEPVAGISWHQASAYAKWAGKRLPTAEEWDRAAGLIATVNGLWEWVADEVKPRGLGRKETKRALKGGPSNASAERAAQSSAWPHEQLDSAGFRCARSTKGE